MIQLTLFVKQSLKDIGDNIKEIVSISEQTTGRNNKTGKNGNDNFQVYLFFYQAHT